jgi:hypothetical protein
VAHPPDLRRLRTPALQVCAMPTAASEYPWVRASTAEGKTVERYVSETLRPFAARLCRRFASDVADGQTIEIIGSHYVFFTKPALAARTIRDFLRASQR